MTTIDARGARAPDNRPYWERYTHAPHFRSKDAEFDAAKIGVWLFLVTEVLLFSGLFCAYVVFRMLYPEAFANGSHYLDWRWGGLNTIVLLVSSFTIAYSIRCAQLNRQGLMLLNLVITWLCALGFLLIKFIFEYIPKWQDGKRPGALFDYPFSHHPNEPLWWSVYYSATAIHAFHVLVGMILIGWLIVRGLRRHFGPTHYTAVEGVGLYWHIVDIIWIFLFPLLYLIH